MEHTNYRSTEPIRGRVHRRVRRGRMLGAAVAVGAMVAVTLPMFSSEAAVAGRRSIEATTTSDLVILNGYPRGRVKIEVLRKGVVVGSAIKSTFQGGIEMNHGGGTDCWESRRTPNIRPGDKIRTTILANRVRDFTVIRGVFVQDPSFDEAGGSITVSGHVNLSEGPRGVNPARDILELRIRKDGNWTGTSSPSLRVDINDDVQPDGTWTHTIDGLETLDVSEAASSNETTLEWSNPGASELTVAEPPGPAVRLTGCPPVEQN